MGENGGIYVLLSTKLLQLAALFVHEEFLTPVKKTWVRGSWIREAFWTIRTVRGELLKVGFSASYPSFNGSSTALSKQVDDVNFGFTGKSLTVTTSEWRTHAAVTKGASRRGNLHLDIQVQPLYDMATEKASPHGLLGQTYDGDGVPKHGKRDGFSWVEDDAPSGSRSTTSGTINTANGKGEGAFEGTAELYRVKSPFDTNFVFTRFGPE